ncbi:hypothetical protein M231_01920 [Tremella mesenterica]|uniref:Uncharacterized protein n=1 Tax=Tremella mesenterica TaxID=5217 RepID=A0A4Q1BS76_TREME|nr:hypothetical protein M231_01920 [Tremella mesenterica]
MSWSSPSSPSLTSPNPILFTPSTSSTVMQPSVPVVPPRSALRSAAPPLRSPPPPVMTHREPYQSELSSQSTLSLETTQTPQTPSLSTGSDDIENDESITIKSTTGPVTSPKPGWSNWGRKKKGKDVFNKDPFKVKDGLPSKEASSGVYTPPTFPGPTASPAHSRHPSTISSSGYFIYPDLPQSPFSPSRTSSGSSASGDTPQTPITPNRFSKFSSAAVSYGYSLKRLSSSITSTPNAGDGYITAMRKSWTGTAQPTPVVPRALYGEQYTEVPRYFPPSPAAGAGLGFGSIGPVPQRNMNGPRSTSQPARTIGAEGSVEGEQKKERGRRKPVPKIEDVTGEVAGLAI